MNRTNRYSSFCRCAALPSTLAAISCCLLQLWVRHSMLPSSDHHRPLPSEREISRSSQSHCRIEDHRRSATVLWPSLLGPAPHQLEANAFHNQLVLQLLCRILCICSRAEGHECTAPGLYLLHLAHLPTPCEGVLQVRFPNICRHSACEETYQHLSALACSLGARSQHLRTACWGHACRHSLGKQEAEIKQFIFQALQ